MNNPNIMDVNQYGFSGDFGTSISLLKNQQNISENINDYHNQNSMNYPQKSLRSSDYDNISNIEKKSMTGNSSSSYSNMRELYNPNLNPNISKLVSDINKSLDDYAPSTSKTETEEDFEEEHTNENEKWLARIPNWIKEIILFVIIYFIFSMGFVKRTIGTYIKYINPDEEGNVSFLGIIIYGIILIVTFMITKYCLGLY